MNNKLKTLLFTGIIGVMILPFNGMTFAIAEPQIIFETPPTKTNTDKKTEQHGGKNWIRENLETDNIPLKNDELNKLFQEKKESRYEFQKLEKQTQLDNIEKSIVDWYAERANPDKEEKVRKAQNLLDDSLMTKNKDVCNELVKGCLHNITGFGYNYVDQAFEIGIYSEFFDNNDSRIKILKLVRQIVGNDVDIVMIPSSFVTSDSTTCPSKTSPCNPIEAGVEVKIGSHGCTVGYPATYNNKSGFVTAGHCAEGLSSTNVNQPKSSSTDIGDVEEETYEDGSSCDCAFISETSTSVSMSGAIVGSTDTLNSSTIPFVGMTVSMAGKTTGITSGSVTHMAYTSTYDIDGDGTVDYSISNMARASYTSTSGDSGGGPVWSGTAIAGINSGHIGTNTSQTVFSAANQIQSTFIGLSWNYTQFS